MTERQQPTAAPASPAAESQARQDFIRSLPQAVVAPGDAPTCRCRTFTLWRTNASERWRCFACDPPEDQSGIEAVRAQIAGRPVWDEATRRWSDAA